MEGHVSVDYRSARAKSLVPMVLVLFLIMALLAISPMIQGGSAAPSAASASADVPVAIIFQKWVSPDPFYSGVADGYISLYEPDKNYGNIGTMRLNPGSGARERLLIKFDISRIGSPATIVEAKLYMYAWYRTQPYKLTAYAYKVRRHWNELETTWKRASTADFWAVSGCQDPVYDYDPSRVASTELSYTEMWYSWDLTQMVQDWALSPSSNEGVVIVADGSANQYQFRTSEIPGENLRPFLEVKYYAGGPTPTATPTRTATASATATSLLSPTATRTPTQTPTQTPVLSPTQTRTPTITPTRTPSPTPVTSVFQFDSYVGVSDTFLSFYRPETPWNGDDSLRISGRESGSARALVRFDLQGLIPSNAQVLSAKVSLFAWSRRTLYGIRISAYDVLRSWNVDQATWNVANGMETWGMAGCEELGTDRDGDPVSSRFVYFTNYFYDWDATPLVQRWITNPASNKGLLFVGHDVDQEILFRASEWRVESQRPRLSVTYIAP
jgi:hypothetical protein